MFDFPGEICLNTQSLFLLSPRRDLKTLWVPKFQLVAVTGCCMAMAMVLVSHSLRGSDAMDTTLEHKSCYKRQLCPQFSQLGFLRVCTEGLKCHSTCCGANFSAWRLSKVRDKGTLRIPGLSWCFCVSLWQGEHAVMSSQSREGHHEHQHSCENAGREWESSLKRVLCGHEDGWLLRSNKIWGILTSTWGVGGESLLIWQWAALGHY